MTTAPALMSCPNVLCDAPGEIISIVREYYARNDPGHYYGYCVRCCCRGPVHDTPEQAIAAWNARPGDAARETAITEAIQALIDASDYFDNRADVNDGDYGEPSPNREMTLASQCDEALERLEALRTHGSQP